MRPHRPWRALLAPALLAGLITFAVGPAQAMPGDLDPTFGTGGTVTTSFGSVPASATAIAIQPDGKIVAVGSTTTNADFALARYNTDGSLDTSFGSDGKVTTGIRDQDFAYAVALQQDGKILVAGASQGAVALENDFAVVRYNADGSLDTSFGTGAKVTTAFGADTGDYASAVAAQPDGKIVVVGYVSWSITPGSNPPVDFALARYNADGSLDTSFGSGGKVTTAIAA